MSNNILDSATAVEPNVELILYWCSALQNNTQPLGDLFSSIGMLKFIVTGGEEVKKKYQTEFDRLLFIIKAKYNVDLYTEFLD